MDRKKEYSAQVAQEKYEYGMTSKGPELILDKDYELLKHIEKEIRINKKSPEVISKQLEENGFNIKISGRSIRHAIKSGVIFEKPNLMINGENCDVTKSEGGKT